MESSAMESADRNGWLILVPTQAELDMISAEPLFEQQQWQDSSIQVCGFGLASSTAHAAIQIEDLAPSRVLLIGIAGSYSVLNSPDPELPIGSAFSFQRIGCYGIGAGEGKRFESATQLGWNQWPSNQTALIQSDIIENISRPIDEPSGPRMTSPERNRMLLSVASCSANSEEATLKKQRFPEALAEDMEGFGVAMLCRLREIPLHVVRGISNIAGDRDKSNWRIKAALEAAVNLANEILLGRNDER